MIAYLVLSVLLSLFTLTRGSPWFPSKDDLRTLESERIKFKTDWRAYTPRPQQFSEMRDDIAGLDSEALAEAHLSSFTPLVNYNLSVDFYLFQRINDDIQVTKLPVDPPEIINAGFEKSRQTKVLIHGYQNDLRTEFPQKIARGYASDFDYNVIAVDWGLISNDILYPRARYHVEGVGLYVGQFIANMYNASLIQPGLHLIGHSLGAHVASYAGKTVQTDGWKIARITGLDPAGILFGDSNERLTKNDADIVDVIHTCMNYLGTSASSGHVDFYPNGGIAIQPGCGFDFTGSCSHGRSFEYFAESMKRPQTFVGQYCKDQNNVRDCISETAAIMGAWLNYTKEGAYSLKTASSSPFGLN